MDKQIIKAKNKYIVGFISSLVLTAVAFILTQLFLNSKSDPPFSYDVLVVLILSLAIIQMVIQLVFFLHVGEETKPKWKLWSLLFGIMVVAIIFIGSLWIMYNLDYNMMSDHNMVDTEIINDELIQPTRESN
jgi:cytochrome o ubiquinol oxidase operon protein cyoD